MWKTILPSLSTLMQCLTNNGKKWLIISAFFLQCSFVLCAGIVESFSNEPPLLTKIYKSVFKPYSDTVLYQSQAWNMFSNPRRLSRSYRMDILKDNTFDWVPLSDIRADSYPLFRRFHLFGLTRKFGRKKGYDEYLANFLYWKCYYYSLAPGTQIRFIYIERLMPGATAIKDGFDWSKWSTKAQETIIYTTTCTAWK